MVRPATPGSAAALAALTSLVLGLGSLVWPFGRDQGNYGYAGWVWWDGGALYRDVFVFKPPLTAVLHGLAIGLFGVDMTAIRIVDLGWEAATSAIVASIGSRLTGNGWIGLAAGLGYAFFYWQADYWNTAQTDGFMNLPIALAIWLALRGSPGRYVGAGACIAVAMAFKYTAVLAVLPVVLAAADRRRALGAGVLGAVVTFGAIALWLLASGAWDAFVDVQFHLVPSYVVSTGPRAQSLEFFRGLVTAVSSRATLRSAGVGALVAGGFLVLGRPTRGLAVALAWAAAGLGSVFVQGRLHTYHFLAVYPGLALLLAIGGRAVAASRFRPVLVLLVPVLLTSQIVRIERRAWNVLSSGQSLREYWSTTRDYRQRDYDTGDVMKVSDVIAAQTSAGDRIFVWGFDPTIHVVSERKGVSRFLYNYPFRVSFGDPAQEAELLGALQATPPELFIVGSGDVTRSVDDKGLDSRELLMQFTALREFVEANYTLDQVVGRYDVYRKTR